MTDLMRYLPNFWQDIVEMKATQHAIEPEVDTLKSNISDLLNQCFVSTATWGLKLWENELGIVSNESLSYEKRRVTLLAKLQGTATTTVAMIKHLAETFSGAAVTVTEHNNIYSFDIFFIGTIGEPKNIKELIAALEECKPAHLGYTLKYRYTTWGEIKKHSRTWGDFLNHTWYDVKVFEEVEI